jgi:hypothetical protein
VSHLMWRFKKKTDPILEAVQALGSLFSGFARTTLSLLKELKTMDQRIIDALAQEDADIKGVGDAVTAIGTELTTVESDQAQALKDLEAAVAAGASQADLTTIVTRLQAQHAALGPITTALGAAGTALQQLDAAAQAADATTKTPASGTGSSTDTPGPAKA